MRSQEPAVNFADLDRPLFWTQDYWELTNGAARYKSESVILDGWELFFTESREGIRVPGAATFGGFWPSDRHRAPVSRFVELYETLFGVFRSGRVEIRFPPEYFHPEIFRPQVEALRILGGREVADTVQVCRPSNLFDVDLVSSLPKGERWWIRKFSREGGEVRPAQSDELLKAYEIIDLNKKRRGAKISTTYEHFSNLVEGKPDIYRCWLATLDDDAVGSALTVEIDRHSTYVLYWADTPKGRKFSVVSSIYAEILRNAVSRKKTVLDLGLSSLSGVIDDGLFSFKKHLGAEAVAQPSFRIR